MRFIQRKKKTKLKAKLKINKMCSTICLQKQKTLKKRKGMKIHNQKDILCISIHLKNRILENEAYTKKNNIHKA